MSDNEVRMRYSDDGYPNWSNWDASPTGREGEYGIRNIWTRLGSATFRTYTFESSSPRSRDMMALVGTIEPTS